MRIIVSFLFTLITILSVVSPVDSFCLSKVHSNENQSGSIHSSYEKAVSSDATSPDHVAGDVCHIGHCSFILASDFVTAHYGQNKLFGSIKHKIQDSEFNQNLFRPPIVDSSQV